MITIEFEARCGSEKLGVSIDCNLGLTAYQRLSTGPIVVHNFMRNVHHQFRGRTVDLILTLPSGVKYVANQVDTYNLGSVAEQWNQEIAKAGL